MIKTIFIPAQFKPITKQSLVKTPTGERKRNWLGIEKDVYETKLTDTIIRYSDCEIDGNKLTEDVNTELEKWGEKLIRIISLTPISSGRYNYSYNNSKIESSTRVFGNTEKVFGGGSYGFGYGFSYTEGIMICIEVEG